MGFVGEMRVHIRCLIVFTAAPHDNVGGASLGAQIPLVHIVAGGGLFEEAHSSRGHAAKVATRIGGDDAKQALTGLFGKIGLFEHALRGVNIGKIKG